MPGRLRGGSAARGEGHPSWSPLPHVLHRRRPGRAKLSCVSANTEATGQQPSATYEATKATRNSAFLKACRREPVPHTPVWFMRQAGRSLPEYHKVREGIPMLDSCMRPDLVAEITMQPVRRHDVDAAILYSDIVVPLKAVGVDLAI